MDSTVYEYLFRILHYATFGFTLEVLFVALSKIADGDITAEDRYLKGSTYLWMIPIYGILLPFIFEPVRDITSEWNILFRFISWAVMITFFEGLVGWIYDKTLGFCPWDYSKSKYKVFDRGYTKWTLVPAWGVAGLVLEKYSDLLIRLSSSL
jgi:uncharacterized membrane protein